MLGIIYEEVEKLFYNSLYKGEEKKVEKYQIWLKEIDQKKITNPELTVFLKNHSSSSKSIYRKKIITELLSGKLEMVKELSGDIRKFETSSFF